MAIAFERAGWISLRIASEGPGRLPVSRVLPNFLPDAGRMEQQVQICTFPSTFFLTHLLPRCRRLEEVL